jgi:hypothetical protein
MSQLFVVRWLWSIGVCCWLVTMMNLKPYQKFEFLTICEDIKIASESKTEFRLCSLFDIALVISFSADINPELENVQVTKRATMAQARHSS